MSREAIANIYCLQVHNSTLEFLNYKPEVDIHWQHPYIRESFQFADRIFSKLRELGYVQLEEDQTLPDGISRYFPRMGARFQDELTKAGFRRVKEIGS